MSRYVYVWMDKVKPLYVGRGSGSRAGQHLSKKPWATGRNQECLVLDCEGENSDLLESFLVQLLGSFGLHNKAIPRAFTPYRTEPLPPEVMSAAWSVMERVGTPPAYETATRFAELLEEARGYAPDFDPEGVLYEYLIGLKNIHGPKNAHLTAWAWLSVWGGDFEALTSAAEEFLYV